MYIGRLKLEWIRTFVKNDIRFVHPDMKFRSVRSTAAQEDKTLLPRPKLPNVNLLLGDNGSGKTTILQAIALACLGPAVRESQLPLRKFVRFPTIERAKKWNGLAGANISAFLDFHEQDGAPEKSVKSGVHFVHMRELERVQYIETSDEPLWDPVYESKNDAFFCAAYGATRRVEGDDTVTSGQPPKVSFLRGQRLQGIFQDSFPLFPLNYWLPQLKSEAPARHDEVVHLLNHLLGPGHYRFVDKMRAHEYLFEKGGMLIPFRSLSDGYRAFIAWVADLLFHMCYGCPPGKKLSEIAGIVLVDEIDLHLHPKWQMKVVGTVARALPRMQFIFTSHSPLVAGSLEWMNIITLKTGAKTNRTVSKRLRQSIHGLDADQILLTDFFGLSSTRASSKRQQLTRLRHEATLGGDEEKSAYVRALGTGTEPEPEDLATGEEVEE